MNAFLVLRTDTPDTHDRVLDEIVDRALDAISFRVDHAELRTDRSAGQITLSLSSKESWLGSPAFRTDANGWLTLAGPAGASRAARGGRPPHLEDLLTRTRAEGPVALLARLGGSFAFAYRNPIGELLVLGAMRAGGPPVYRYEDEHVSAVASDARLLARVTSDDRLERLNPGFALVSSESGRQFEPVRIEASEAEPGAPSHTEAFTVPAAGDPPEPVAPTDDPSIAPRTLPKRVVVSGDVPGLLVTPAEKGQEFRVGGTPARDIDVAYRFDPRAPRLSVDTILAGPESITISGTVENAGPTPWNVRDRKGRARLRVGIRVHEEGTGGKNPRPSLETRAGLDREHVAPGDLTRFRAELDLASVAPGRLRVVVDLVCELSYWCGAKGGSAWETVADWHGLPPKAIEAPPEVFRFAPPFDRCPGCGSAEGFLSASELEDGSGPPPPPREYVDARCRACRLRVSVAVASRLPAPERDVGLYEPGWLVDLRTGGNGDDYVVDGFAAPSGGGRWTLGTDKGRLALRIPQSDEAPSEWLRLRARARGLAGADGRTNRARLTVDGRTWVTWTLEDGEVVDLSTDLPARVDGSILVLGFSADDPASPVELGIGEDERVLGLSIEHVALDPIRTAAKTGEAP